MPYTAYHQSALVREAADRRLRSMGNRVRRICWLSSAVVVCMLLAGAEMARAVVTENVLTRVFALRFGSELVSGFAIELDERQYLVTARHALSASVSTGTVEVLQNKSWVQLSFRRLQVEPQEVDIAILVLDRKLTSAPPIRLGERGTILSQGVYFVGFPYGLSIEAHAVNSGFPIPLVKHGIIAALHTGTLGQPFLVDGINNPGFSGGPVVRDDREMIPTIIGVVSGYQASQEPVYRQKLKTELTVEVNTGLLVAYPIDYAVEAIKKDPSGYHVGAQP